MLRYNQFVKEKITTIILSKEDIEDQFLRLKEVFGINIGILYDMNNSGSYRIRFNPYIFKNSIGELEELNRIKNRMEIEYPDIIFEKKVVNSIPNIIIGVNISLKEKNIVRTL